jgi:hypothetical protein
MAKELNPRQQRFVAAYLKTGIASLSYALAGYQPTTRESQDNAASRLLGNVGIKAAIRQKRRAMLKRSDITIEKLLSDTEDARKLAMASAQPSAATGAVQLQAKLVGLLVDRRETGQPGDFAGLTTADEVIAAIRAEMGEDAAKALASLVAKATPAQAAPAEEAPIPTVQGSDSLN